MSPQNKKRFIFLVILIALFIAVRFLGLHKYITLEQLKLHRIYLRQLVHTNYTKALLLYILTYIFVVAFSLPLAAVLTIAGGFMFGTFWGAVYSNVGATTGGILAFLSVRYLLGDYLQKKYAKQLVWFNGEMEKYGSLYLLIIHLIAMVPFFLVNILAGLTTISLWTFVWTTSVGIFPGAFIYTFAGQQLMTINKVSDVFSAKIILAFLFLAILGLTPLILQRIFNTKKLS